MAFDAAGQPGDRLRDFVSHHATTAIGTPAGPARAGCRTRSRRPAGRSAPTARGSPTTRPGSRSTTRTPHGLPLAPTSAESSRWRPGRRPDGGARLVSDGGHARDSSANNVPTHLAARADPVLGRHEHRLDARDLPQLHRLSDLDHGHLANGGNKPPVADAEWSPRQGRAPQKVVVRRHRLARPGRHGRPTGRGTSATARRVGRAGAPAGRWAEEVRAMSATDKPIKTGMPSGACVIRYEGARGAVWRIKYRRRRGPPGEGDGRPRGGRLDEAEGGAGARRQTRRRHPRPPEAEAPHVLRSDRRVRRGRAAGEAAEEVARSSTTGCTIRLHLRPALGHFDLEKLSRSPEEFERYAGDKIAAGLSPKSVRNHLVLAGLMFKTARRWRWVSENPLELVEPPSMPTHETETLTAAEIAAVLKAYRVLEAAADDDGEAVVRRRTTHDDRGALHRSASRRAARAAVAGRRAARPADPRSAAVRPERDHDAEEPRGTPDAPARRRGGEGARGAVRRRPGTGRPSRSCSAIRRSGRRSTRRS